MYRLIKHLPKDLKVLDVGCGGLYGENTSEYLIAHFGVENITGVCTSEREVGIYHARRAEMGLPEVSIRVEDFYKMEPEKYDVVVLDLNIENNLKDWTDKGLEYAKKFLKPGGYLINYVMVTDQYKDEDTGEMIKVAWADFFGGDIGYEQVGKKLSSLKDFKLLGQVKEERRPYILWVLLQYERMENKTNR